VSVAYYRARVTDAELTDRLRSSGAVLVEGPKACGKTETSRQQAGSVVMLDVDQLARAAAQIDPTLILSGPTPRLLDEWQVVPQVWNAIRRQVDERGADGQFILTGSATPADDITRHTGAGRIARLRMRTMSMFETGHSSSAVSLAAIVAGIGSLSCPDPGLDLADLIELVCRGGWPAGLHRSLPDAQRGVRDYLDEIRRADIQTLDGMRRDPIRVGAVLAALARNVATEVTQATLAADAAGRDLSGRPRTETVSDYLNALTRLFLVEQQPAWAVHLRSKSRVRATPKQHFVDPSLAVAALGATPADLRADLSLFGLLFESMVIRDLRIYAQLFGAEIRHYRDNTGLEVDAIVTGGNDRWVAIEIKLGATTAIVDAAAANLRKFADRIDTTRCGDPSALVVIVGNGYGYQRPDGVLVVPIGALCP